MVGGAEEEFTAAKELLSCMGTNVIYCGQVGTGQVRDAFHARNGRVAKRVILLPMLLWTNHVM